MAAVAFAAKSGGPNLLRSYIERGIGDCRKIPILCLSPAHNIIDLSPDTKYLQDLLPYDFPDMKVGLPKGFTVIKEKIKKPYYKKKKDHPADRVIYLLYEKPDFFIHLYPQLKSQGVNSNLAFIWQTMYTRLSEVRHLKDIFFVIMKSIFIPDLGNQAKVTMKEFSLEDKKGFINYNIGVPTQYFDCHIINKRDAYFRVYIKDKGGNLDLAKVLAIISTVKDASF